MKRAANCTQSCMCSLHTKQTHHQEYNLSGLKQNLSVLDSSWGSSNANKHAAFLPYILQFVFLINEALTVQDNLNSLLPLNSVLPLSVYDWQLPSQILQDRELRECKFCNKNQQVTFNEKNPHFFQIIFVLHSIFCQYKADPTMKQERMANILTNDFAKPPSLSYGKIDEHEVKSLFKGLRVRS